MHIVYIIARGNKLKSLNSQLAEKFYTTFVCKVHLYPSVGLFFQDKVTNPIIVSFLIIPPLFSTFVCTGQLWPSVGLFSHNKVILIHVLQWVFAESDQVYYYYLRILIYALISDNGVWLDIIKEC